MAVVRSKSPLRISFAGGGTDVLPYMADHGGVVLSATIDKYAYASLRLCAESSITVTYPAHYVARDLGEAVSWILDSVKRVNLARDSHGRRS